MLPLVSFILPSFNREPILKTVLSELLSQRFSFACEILVIDNNSSDGSVNMVQSLFPTVRLISLQENLGAISRNIALHEARGTYVVMLDDDSYPLGRSIETAVHIFEEADDGVGCIAFNIRRPDGSYETAGIYRNFTGCGVMFRRSIFEVVGYYPAEYLFYVEEYDLSARIWQHGYRVLNFRELEVVHLKTNVNRNFSNNLSRLVKNNMLLWSKYLPPELAGRQIDMELWRYEKIGLKEDALDGFVEGKQRGAVHLQEYLQNRQYEVSAEVARILLDLDNIAAIVADLKREMAGSAILVFNIGKLLTYLIEELKKSDFNIVGIVDDNTFMQQAQFEGIQVFPRSRFDVRDYDGVVIGSSSLAINDDLEHYLRELELQVPFRRLCNYDTLSDYVRVVP